MSKFFEEYFEWIGTVIILISVFITKESVVGSTVKNISFVLGILVLVVGWVYDYKSKK